MFVPQKVTLVVGEEPKEIAFQPVANITVEGQIKFSRSRLTKPNANLYASYKPTIIGKVNGLEYSADASVDSQGKFTASVPRGANDVQVRFAESRGPQVRVGNETPLVDPSAINLGTVNEDVRDVEIVYP